MAQVLEYLAEHQAQAPALASAEPITPAPELTPSVPVVTQDVPEPDVSMAEEDQDMISRCNRFYPIPNSILALVERATKFLQHYILAFGGIIAVPLILAEPMCFGDNNSVKSQLISTIFLVSGLCTLLQTTFGTRLPILQGGTFSFLTPTLAILALPEWRCPDIKEMLFNTTNNTEFNRDEIWKSRMREIQGAILVASLLQLVLGLTGLVGFVLRCTGPLTIAPTITLIGLSLFVEAGKKSGAHWGIAAM
ncbi:S23A2 protein, partial [Polyodon spathula]|nr:S23A2 protein [Polyodon spathula]